MNSIYVSIENRDDGAQTMYRNMRHGQCLGLVRARIQEYKKDGVWRKRHIPLEQLTLGVETDQNTVFAIRIVRDGVYKHVEEAEYWKGLKDAVCYEIQFAPFFKKEVEGFQIDGESSCLRVVEMVLENDGCVTAVLTEHAIIVQKNIKYYTCQEVGRWRVFQDEKGVYTQGRNWPEFDAFVGEYLPQSIRDYIAGLPRLPEHGDYQPPKQGAIDAAQSDVVGTVKRWNHAKNYGIIQVKDAEGVVCDLRVSFNNITDSEAGEFYELLPGEEVVISQIWLSEERSFKYNAFGVRKAPRAAALQEPVVAAGAEPAPVATAHPNHRTLSPVEKLAAMWGARINGARVVLKATSAHR